MKDVHKHERAMHPGKPLTKLAKGGKAAGFKKGGKTDADMLKHGRGMAKVMNQKVAP